MPTFTVDEKSEQVTIDDSQHRHDPIVFENGKVDVPDDQDAALVTLRSHPLVTEQHDEQPAAVDAEPGAVVPGDPQPLIVPDTGEPEQAEPKGRKR